MRHVSLGDRIKSYERLYDFCLIGGLPICIRLDGKNFHSLTKRLKLEKPFDSVFAATMAGTAVSIASQIQDCVIGYVQSDEISFIVRNGQGQDSEPYFGNRIQKIVSITASMATARFNKLLALVLIDPNTTGIEAFFDSRVFIVPAIAEAVNVLVWRQRDCTKNSISGAAYYEIGKVHGKKTARKMLEGLNQDQRQELLFKETGLNWNDYAPEFKRGIVIFKREEEVETEHGKAMRRRWTTEPAPIFTGEEGRAWLCEILGHTRSVKENVEEKEGIR